jgi:hypothetical protein
MGEVVLFSIATWLIFGFMAGQVQFYFKRTNPLT